MSLRTAERLSLTLSRALLEDLELTLPGVLLDPGDRELNLTFADLCFVPFDLDFARLGAIERRHGLGLGELHATLGQLDLGLGDGDLRSAYRDAAPVQFELTTCCLDVELRLGLQCLCLLDRGGVTLLPGRDAGAFHLDLLLSERHLFFMHAVLLLGLLLGEARRSEAICCFVVGNPSLLDFVPIAVARIRQEPFRDVGRRRGE